MYSLHNWSIRKSNCFTSLILLDLSFSKMITRSRVTKCFVYIQNVYAYPKYKKVRIPVVILLMIFCNTGPHLQQFEVLSLWEHDFIPHDLYTFFCVHGQVCSVHPWDITLIHLPQEATGKGMVYFVMFFPAEKGDNISHKFISSKTINWNLEYMHHIFISTFLLFQ